MYVFEVPLVMIAHDAFSWWQKEGNEARFERRDYIGTVRLENIPRLVQVLQVAMRVLQREGEERAGRKGKKRDGESMLFHK